MTHVPLTAVPALNKIGVVLTAPASIAACFSGTPSAVLKLIKSINNTEFLTIIPAKAIMPINEVAVKNAPMIQCPKIIPMSTAKKQLNTTNNPAAITDPGIEQPDEEIEIIGLSLLLSLQLKARDTAKNTVNKEQIIPKIREFNTKFIFSIKSNFKLSMCQKSKCNKGMQNTKMKINEHSPIKRYCLNLLSLIPSQFSAVFDARELESVGKYLRIKVIKRTNSSKEQKNLIKGIEPLNQDTTNYIPNVIGGFSTPDIQNRIAGIVDENMIANGPGGVPVIQQNTSVDNSTAVASSNVYTHPLAANNPYLTALIANRNKLMIG